MNWVLKPTLSMPLSRTGSTSRRRITHARDFARNELLKAAEAAAILKVRYFVVHPGPEKASLPDHERFWRLQNAVGVLNQTLRHCRQLGVGLVLENMLPHLFAGRIRDLLWILGALDTL